ncbi:MAG TPA: carboxypeptidase-like regulatory domain-containing protein, partial [Vicinamibacteria bacterium]|nr:carboxypeptidase-like regulatory domain-containing protein [Vicinamibacteria bacterium]
MRFVRVLAALVALTTAWPAAAAADDATGLVVDQSGSMVPAAAVTLARGETVVGATRTGTDGGFVLSGTLPGDLVVVALTGFETVRVAAGRDLRIVLRIAAATTTVDATASIEGPAAVGAASLGGRMSREMMQRMPVARHNVRASLPLLPSVVRGPD